MRNKEEVLRELKEQNMEFSKSNGLEKLVNLIFTNNFNKNKGVDKNIDNSIELTLENNQSFEKTKRYLNFIEKSMCTILIIMLMQIMFIYQLTQLSNVVSSLILSNIFELCVIVIMWFTTFILISPTLLSLDFLYLNREDKRNGRKQ